MNKKKLLRQINETKAKIKNMRESKQTFGLAALMESELDKAELVLAVKGISDELQSVAEKVAKMEVEEIMPILDSLKAAFGPEMADNFSNVTTQNLRNLVEAIKTAKDAIGNEILRLEGAAGGAVMNDMAMSDDTPDLGGDDLGADVPAPEMGDADMGAEIGGDADLGGDDLDPDAGLDGNPDDFQDPAAGRARKESAGFLTTKNPDKYVFEAVVKRVRKGATGPDAAKAVAESLGLDYSDVVEIVSEHTTSRRKKMTEAKDGRITIGNYTFDPKTDRIYLAGKKLAKEGGTVDENPYHVASINGKVWKAGFDS